MNNPVGAATDVNAAYYGAESAGRLDYWRKMAAPRARMATALRFIAERNPRRLIDIGCGSGLVLAEISRGSPGVELAGADLSETQIQANRRSHHDIDSDDSVGNRETISYEVYGAQWRRGAFRVLGGVWYDRGTTRDGRAQTLPFDHYLGGVRVDGLVDLGGPLYASGALEAVAHRDGEHSPIPYLNTGGILELGVRRRGPAAEVRVGLSLRRIEDPLFLGQPARHLLLLSLRTGSGVLTL